MLCSRLNKKLNDLSSGELSDSLSHNKCLSARVQTFPVQLRDRRFRL